MHMGTPYNVKFKVPGETKYKGAKLPPLDPLAPLAPLALLSSAHQTVSNHAPSRRACSRDISRQAALRSAGNWTSLLPGLRCRISAPLGHVEIHSPQPMQRSAVPGLANRGQTGTSR